MPKLNTQSPRDMAPAEIIDQIGAILAQGLMRLLGRKSRDLSPDRGDSSIDLSQDGSSHATPKRRVRDDDKRQYVGTNRGLKGDAS
jgi:hypothetical protein